MAEERDEALYLADIRDAVEKILRYTSGGRDEFFADSLLQDAVIRNLEVMGEAVRKVSTETRECPGIRSRPLGTESSTGTSPWISRSSGRSSRRNSLASEKPSLRSARRAGCWPGPHTSMSRPP
jgi:hypothetical protein